MKTNTTGEEPKKEDKEIKVYATVIVPKIRIGPIIAGRGAKLHLSKTEADALAKLTPPAVRIDGI